MNTENIELYKPDLRFRRMSDITYEEILSWNVKAVALDVDHTLFYDCAYVYVSHAGKWLRDMVKRGVKFVIVTNAGIDRPFFMWLRHGIPFVGFANKPKPDGYIKAAKKVGCKPEELAFIGDRLSTDVKGANAVGALSVYVEPPAKDFLYFHNKKKRAREKELLKQFFGE